MILIDNKYFGGSQYFINAIVYSIAVFLITKDKIKPDYSNPMFNLGFLFSIIGLTIPLGQSLHVGIWALGIIFFLSGLLKNNIVRNYK